MSSNKECPECGASGNLKGMYGTEPVVREMSEWFQCVKCGHTWDKEDS